MTHSITLQNLASTAIVNNDILGQIAFAAPNEAGGTDSILIAASIFARSEGTFASDNNATELVFVTGTTESAAPGAANYDMTLSSAGNLTVVGTITCATSLTIGSAAMSEADLEFLDGITAGTAAASKAVVLDGSKNIATIGTLGCGAITSTGSSSFATSVKTPLIEYTDGDDAITIADGGSTTFAQQLTASKAIKGAIVTATEDATVVIDLSTSNYFEITLGANVTDIDFTNGSVGQRFVIRFEQPAGANYTIVYSAVTHDLDGGGSPATVTVSWPGGTAPTMTATNDKADTYGFIVRAEGHFDGYVIGQNIAETTN